MSRSLREKFLEILSFCDEGIEMFANRIQREHPDKHGADFLEAYKKELQKCKNVEVPNHKVVTAEYLRK